MRAVPTMRSSALASTRAGRKLRRLCAGLLVCLLSMAEAQSREFRIGLITPPGHLWTEAAEGFSRELTAASEGEHRLTVFPSRQLGNEAQMLQLMQTGALDFAILTVSEISNRMPRFGALYRPYLVPDAAGAARLLRGPTARGMLERLPETLGVFGVGYGMAGMRHILSREPVTSVGDLRGRKLRITPFVPIRDFYQLVGAAPTPMPLSSVFDALANGQIDAIDMDLETIWKLRYYDYADTLVISTHMMFPAIGLMSGKTWLQLEPPLRQQLTALFSGQLDAVLDLYPALERQWEEQVAATGVTVLKVGPEFFRGVVPDWERTWRPRAPELDVLKLEAAAGHSGTPLAPADPEPVGDVEEHSPGGGPGDAAAGAGGEASSVKVVAQ